MQFKYPELLYALFLLIIPVLIHLFQLRRFQKVQFTNVKFLKSVKLQTRKSSQLKKWLTLVSRLLLLAFAIVAFSQPYIPNETDFNESQETVIYLDNSFSMEAQGNNGSLLNEAIQDMINGLPEDETISLFTNTKTYKSTSIKAIKNELIQLEHSPTQLNYDVLLLKGKQLFSNDQTSTKNLVLVSDFQQKDKTLTLVADSSYNLKLVQPKPAITTNVSIDSLYISNTNAETIDLKVLLSNQGNTNSNVTVSLYNNETLLTKSALDVETEAETIFTIANKNGFNGKLVIEDNGLQYDNTFYFNFNSKPKIKVLTINNNSSDDFLKRIYTSDEFEYLSFGINALNFNLIPDQNLIILNELERITDALLSALKLFKNEGGHIIIIPSVDISLNSYSQIFKEFTNNNIVALNSSEKRVTTINYNHPLLANTFYSKVSNFQYPKVNKSYVFSSSMNTVLSYEDENSFLSGSNGFYIFSSALNKDNSNFKNSPLIVPVLYNLGIQSLELAQLYYTIGQPNTIAIPSSLGQDEILTLHSANNSVIPLQKTYSNSVVIETSEFPNEAGILEVKNKARRLENLSFNYNRDESQLLYFDINALDDVLTFNNLEETINDIKSSTTINALWKWFVIFALVFLIIEILLLKYLK